MRLSFTHTALLLCLVALLGPVTDCALAKRFDCELFCRTTGFHGNVGGCRCSFTLFTSKRRDESLNGMLQEMSSGSSQSSSSGATSGGASSPYTNGIPHDELERYIRI